jgi:ribosomal protein S3AE
MQQEVLKGESSAMNTITAGQVQQGLNAANLRNQTVARLADTNMDIRKQQEQTKNQLALQRGQVEGQLALKRFGAGMAMAGARAFA